jgi:aminoglycoside phosphotransferase (APT) family kinase protein
MTSLKPESLHILTTILRELEETLAPELTSVHSRTVAHLLGQGLRNLITRESCLPELLGDWLAQESALLDAINIDTNCDAPQDQVACHYSLGAKLDAYIQQRDFAPGDISDPITIRAMTAEKTFYDQHQHAIDVYTPPARSKKDNALFDITPDRLTAYLKGQRPEFDKLIVSEITPILSGFSKETILVEMEVNDKPYPIVIRRNITYGAVDTSVADEFPLVKSLFNRGLQVPEPVLLETDKSIFGEVFSITKRAQGSAACNSMAGLVAGPELKNASLELAGFLATLHQLDLQSLGLPEGFYNDTLSTHDYLVREIDICEKYQADHGMQPSPTLTAGLKWLRANIPDVDGQPRLVHGDAGLTNLMMADDRISVMLDWELAHPGDPVEDLAYSRKWIDQVMPWEEFLQHYYACGGVQYHPDREKFYAILSDLRVAVFSLRTIDMLQKSDQPMVTHMYGAQHYYGHFIRQIAAKLTS